MPADVTRLSTLFGRTLRDDPADAEVASHRLLVRAGYIRRVAPGVFSWLPLGLRVLRNVERVVREEMDAAGFQEIHLPALLPREPYERTGRWAAYGDDLFRLQDRRGNDLLLGPTHEELFTLLVADQCSSYRDLPLVLYQIQTKYRDEVRPRAGLLRSREFLMKDSYSFDVDDDGLARSYDRHRDAYLRVFARLRLDHVVVAATAGAMGGSRSEEFIAPCSAGEDTFVRCAACGLAANVEALTTPTSSSPQSPRSPRDASDTAPATVHDTPGTSTIETLVAHLNRTAELARSDRRWEPSDTLKNLLVTLHHPAGTVEPLAIGLPGDRDVDMKRLAAAVTPAQPVPFGDDEFERHPGLVRGYVGPGMLGQDSPTGIRYLVDPRVADGTRWVTGANEQGRHVVGLVAGRDFQPDGMIDVAEVRDGDPCPACPGTLSSQRGIEIGHIFQLGRKYSLALGLSVLDERGERVVVTMGSYGIGISRAVAAIAEQTHDDLGLAWPPSVAPADVHIVATGKDERPFAVAGELAESLAARGVHVLLDDRRDASAGVKFADAELIGIPSIMIVGRGLANGVVELRDRSTGERVDVALGETIGRVTGSTPPRAGRVEA